MRKSPVLIGWREEQDDCPRSIPWKAIEPHRRQAEENHCGQTLERLAQRGGLCPSEIYLAISGLPLFRNKISDEEIYRRGRELLKRLNGSEP